MASFLKREMRKEQGERGERRKRGESGERRKRGESGGWPVTCSSIFPVGPSTTSLGTDKHLWPVQPAPAPEEGERRKRGREGRRKIKE